jgi:hypothetical protein
VRSAVITVSGGGEDPALSVFETGILPAADLQFQANEENPLIP